MNKKRLVISIIAGVLVLLLLAIGAVMFLKKPAQTAPSDQKEEQVQRDVPLNERPFVTLLPRNDGKALTIQLLHGVLGAPVSTDYQLIYMAGDKQQGAGGSIAANAFTDGTYSKELLLGSCSKGVCTYDKDVESGQLDLTMEYEKETLEFSTTFRLDKVEAGKVLMSKDSKFSLTPTVKQITGKPYAATLMTLGLPSPLTGKIISKPYGVFSSGDGVSGGSVTFHSVSGAANPQIAVYSMKQKAWTSFPAVFDASAQTVTFNATSSGVFVLLSD